MRTIDDHQVNPANDTLTITVVDEPGSGGANHLYRVENPQLANDPAFHLIHFQEGPIAEAGVNGITHEVLLAIVADRLQCFQAGPYASSDNARALIAVREAMTFLQNRTRERIARGVEGTHQL